MELQKGMVVKSVSGHDSGIWHIVMKIDEKGFAYIADGRKRKTDAPKKKNPRHLTKTKEIHAISDNITDRKLRELLHGRNFAKTAAGLCPKDQKQGGI